MLPIEHPLLGWGLLVRLLVPRRNGARRAAWLANALNLAEAADWRGEVRPHALGAWTSDEGTLAHHAFFPGNTVGDLNPDAAGILVRSLLAWGMVRARFAGERLPWLDAAAASRYPDDEPPEDGEAESEPAEEEPGPAEPEVPLAERSFGPNARTPRPRPAGAEPHAPRELLVDPADPSAYREIDDAVAAAGDGDRIRVRPGTYRRPVVVDRAVSIEGDGDRAAIILEPVGGECLGFAVSGRDGRRPDDPPVAGRERRGGLLGRGRVRDVAATIERCDLTSHLGATVWVGGPSSLAVVRDCTLADGAQNGVYVAEEGRAELIGSRVRGHRWSLIGRGPARLAPRRRLRDHRQPRRRHRRRGRAPCWSWSGPRSRATPARASCAWRQRRHPRSPTRPSPGTVAPASPSVAAAASGSCATGWPATRAGIIVDEGASPALEENEVADNADVGIGVTGDMTDPLVTGNAITSRRPAGIVVRQGAAGTFERNRLAAGDAAGIWVADDAVLPGVPREHRVGRGGGGRAGLGRRRGDVRVERPPRQRRRLVGARAAGRAAPHGEPRGRRPPARVRGTLRGAGPRSTRGAVRCSATTTVATATTTTASASASSCSGSGCGASSSPGGSTRAACSRPCS